MGKGIGKTVIKSNQSQNPPVIESDYACTFSEERSDDLYEQTLLGLLVTYTDPYEQAGLGMIGLYVK